MPLTTTEHVSDAGSWYTFVWSPEGRTLCQIQENSIKSAKAEFKRQFPAHAKYMGEVYVEVSK